MICKFNTENNEKKVIWEITNKCNYSCKYCIFNANSDFKKLSKTDCFKIIDQLIANGFNYIKFTGGEPFIRKDFLDILEYADKKIKFDISTNASLITQKDIERLKKINIEFIHVSLDGLLNENDFIRGNNTFNKTLDGLKLLTQTNKYIRIGTVLYKNNENKILEFIKFIEKLNVNEVIFSIMEPFGILNGNKELYITKSMKELSFIINNINSNIKISYNWNEKINKDLNCCPAGKKILFIDNNGFVSPCSWAEKVNKKYKSIISLKEESLENILKTFNIDSNICLYDKEYNK